MKPTKSKPKTFSIKSKLLFLIVVLTLGYTVNSKAQLGTEATQITGDYIGCSDSNDLRGNIGSINIENFSSFYYSVKWFRTEYHSDNWEEIENNHIFKTLYDLTDYSKSYRYYRLIINNSDPDETYKSNEVSIILLDKESAGTIKREQTINPGEIPNKLEEDESASDLFMGLSYKWEKKSINDQVFSTINGATENEYQPGQLTETTYFRRRVVYNDACYHVNVQYPEYYSNVIKIEVVTNFSTDRISGDQKICYNETPQKLSGNVISIIGYTTKYKWQYSTNGTFWEDFGNTASFQPGNLMETTYYRRLVSLYSGGTFFKTVISNVVTIEVSNQINRGSFAVNLSYCYGHPINPITTTALPSGGTPPYTFQWQYSTDNTNWLNAANGTGAGLENPQEPLITNLYYRRMVADSEGCEMVSTFTKIGEASPKVLPGNMSTSSEYICPNSVPGNIICSEQENAEINVWKNNTGHVLYQWEQSIDMKSWSEIQGAESKDYQPTVLPQKTYYRRKLYGVYCEPFYSDIKTIDVYSSVVSGSVSENQTICYHTVPTQMSISEATGGSANYTYQWQKMVSGTSWTDILNATDRVYTPDELTITTYFRVKITSCDVSYSETITVNVLDEFKVGASSENQTICYSTTPEELNIQEATGTNGEFSYQWQKSYNNQDWLNIIGHTNQSYQPPNLTQTTHYRVKITNSTCNKIVYTSTITVNVMDVLTGGNVGLDQIICYGTTPEKLNVDEITGGTGAYSYQWQKSINGNSWNPITGETHKDYQPSSMIQTTYFRRVTHDDCQDLITDIITIEVSEQVKPGTLTEPQTVCNNENPLPLISTEPTGGIGGFIYNWQKSSNQIEWNDIAGTENLAYQPESLNEQVYYRLKSSNTCGDIVTLNTWVQVYEELNVTSIGSSQVIVYGNIPEAMNSTSPVNGGSGIYNFQWRKSLDNINWTNIINGSQESYQPASLTQTTFFQRVATDVECGSITSNTVQIIVANENAVVGTIGTNQKICFGDTPVELIDIEEGIGIVSQQWQKYLDGSEWTDIAEAIEKNYQPSPLTQTTYFRKKVKTGGNGELYTNVIKVEVEAELEPGTIIGNQEICEGIKPLAITTGESPNVIQHSIIWEESNDGARWTELGQESNTYLEVEPLASSKYYRKKIITDCAESYTKPVYIKINSALNSGYIESNQNIAYDEIPEEITGTIPTGSNGIYTYEWEKSYDGVNWSKIADSYDTGYQPDKLKITTQYRRLVNSGNCGTVTTNSIVIRVNEELTPGVIGNNQTVCYGDIPEKILGTEASGGIGIFSYIWERSTDGETWEQLYGKTLKDIVPTNSVTKTTYYRRKAISGTTTSISNIVRIDHLPEVITPNITYTDRYCKGANISINSNIDKVSWYDENMNFASNKSILTTTANESTKYYYQIENTIGCKGDLKPVNLTVDFINADIQTNAINSRSVENGERLTITPNISSNFSADKIKYTWTFDHQQQGWYETMFDESPSQYFHWKGSYDITLVTKTPTGCEFTSESLSAFYINEETEDTRVKSAHTGTKKYLDPNFGLNKEVSINVYPSLFDAVLNVELNNVDSKANLYLHDVAGRIVLTKSIDEGLNLISTDALAKGVYIVRITSKKDAKVFNAKVIKH